MLLLWLAEIPLSIFSVIGQCRAIRAYSKMNSESSHFLNSKSVHCFFLSEGLQKQFIMMDMRKELPEMLRNSVRCPQMSLFLISEFWRVWISINRRFIYKLLNSSWGAPLKQMEIVQWQGHPDTQLLFICKIYLPPIYSTSIKGVYKLAWLTHMIFN